MQDGRTMNDQGKYESVQNNQGSQRNNPHITILYLDDEPGLLEAVRLTLEDSGNCIVDTAPSADVALEKLQVHQYDAIISDYDMPEVDGIKFLSEVRERYGEIPFILYTGVDREEILIRAINAGINFYVQKGGDPEPQFAELLHIITQAVISKRTEQALIECEGRYRMLKEKFTDVQNRI